jgi:hypothetical protein
VRWGASSPVWIALAAVGTLWWMQASCGPGMARNAGSPGLTGAELHTFNQRHCDVPFSDLGAFVYRPPQPSTVSAAQRDAEDPVPPSIRALNGRDVRIDGFMLPLDYDESGVSLFILNASYDMCAFGAPAVINQQVTVRMAEGRRAAFTHLPVRVFGRFEVGEEYAAGRLVSLYRLTATALASKGL